MIPKPISLVLRCGSKVGRSMAGLMICTLAACSGTAGELEAPLSPTNTEEPPTPPPSAPSQTPTGGVEVTRQTLPTISPPPVPELEVATVIVGSGGDLTMLLTADGQLWGGHGGTPEQVLSTETIISAANGANHILAVNQAGEVFAWGYNPHGQLGLEDPEPQFEPVRIPGINGAVEIAAGLHHSMALTNDGAVWTWGNNEHGQLGDGTTISRPKPAKLPDLSSILEIAGGGSYGLALRDDRVVFAWGGNDFGQLGDGTTDTRLAPVQVRDLDGITSIATGISHSLALAQDGTVWAWGNNNRGQLGVSLPGDNPFATTPVQISGLPHIIAIAAGGRHSLAVAQDGTVWAWGANDTGQLGIGNTEDGPIPVKVPNLHNIVIIAAGRYHTIALDSDGVLWGWGDRLLLCGAEGDGIQLIPTKLIP